MIDLTKALLLNARVKRAWRIHGVADDVFLGWSVEMLFRTAGGYVWRDYYPGRRD